MATAADRLVLADDALVEALLHVNQLLDFAFHQPAHRDVGPLGDDLGDVLLVDLLLEHPLLLLQLGEPRLLFLDPALELGQLAVLQLGRLRVVAGALRQLDVQAHLLELLLQLAHVLDGFLLLLPVRLQPRLLFLEVGQLLLELGQPLARRLVLFLAQRLALDLELHDAAAHLVELRRHRVDLHAQLRRGLVHEVDRLVRQEPVGDVAMREHGRGDERRVLELHAVMNLVALAQAAQDRDRVLDGRLADHHRLEAALERRVLLDVLAVLVERRGADRVQLAAREHRLEHLRRVHRALGGAGADDRVQLVDEEDDQPFGVGDLLEHRLQALLELAAVLGAGDERAHVEREDLLVLQPFRHVAADDPLRESFDDGRLADAGLADEDRVVLRPARQHLDRAADFLVAADDRIELALARELGEVAAVPGERLVGRFRILRRDALVAAHLRQRRVQRVLRDASSLQQLRGRGAARLRWRARAAGARC